MMKFKSVLRHVAALGCAALWLVSTPARSQNLNHDFVVGIGVSSGQGRTAFDPAEPVMQWAGIKSVRQEVYWHRLELSKGDLKFPPNLKDVERFIDFTQKGGGMPLLVLDYGNKFYDGGDGVGTQESIDGFTRYASFVANRFKGRVKLYEVWNEWNIGLGSNKNPKTIRDAESYVRLLKATYKAIKAVDPEAIVIGGSVSSIDTKWVSKFIEADGLKYLDGFSVHPYLMWNANSKPEHSLRWVENMQMKVKANQPDRNIPIYITEIGWPNHDAKITWSENQTADFLIRLYLLARSEPYIKGVWWYELLNGGRAKDNKEKTFGIVDADYKAKPALLAYQVASKIVTNAVEISTKVDKSNNGKISFQAKMKDGSICRGHWRMSGAPIQQASSDAAKFTTLWGDPGILSETPYVGCQTMAAAKLPAALATRPDLSR